MDHDIAQLFIGGATCIAAGVLAFVTWRLVLVTQQHAGYAEKMAAAADRLGEILDRQAKALTDVTELHALVTATAIPTPHTSRAAVESLIAELQGRRDNRKS